MLASASIPTPTRPKSRCLRYTVSLSSSTDVVPWWMLCRQNTQWCQFRLCTTPTQHLQEKSPHRKRVTKGQMNSLTYRSCSNFKKLSPDLVIYAAKEYFPWIKPCLIKKLTKKTIRFFQPTNKIWEVSKPRRF